MPFLRSSTLSASTVLAVACAMTLAVVAPSPAQAQLDATPRLVNDALPARALPLAPAADAAHFCPRPTGSWWEDIAVRGCIEVLAGRDHATPLTDVELTWLDLGGLPAYATLDIDAIDASLAAYEQRLADEAAAEAAAEQAARDAAAAAARARRGARTTTRAAGARDPMSVMPTGEQIERMMADCGVGPDHGGPLGEHPCIAAAWAAMVGSGSTGDSTARSGPSEEEIRADRENAAYDACLDRLGSLDTLDRAASAAYFDAHARCVDAQVPGYYARWAAEEARRQVEYDKAMEREAAARARLAIRREAALQEIRDTCPNGGFAAPTKYFVSSYDEVEYVVSCYD